MLLQNHRLTDLDERIKTMRYIIYVYSGTGRLDQAIGWSLYQASDNLAEIRAEFNRVRPLCPLGCKLTEMGIDISDEQPVTEVPQPQPQPQPQPANEVTAEQVLRKIASDDKFAVNCLVKLYERQTQDEKEVQATGHKNKMGFNSVDAGILSSFAEQVLRWRTEEQPQYPNPLSQKQMSLLRSKLQKYARQLTDITNAALAGKQVSAPKPAPTQVDAWLSGKTDRVPEPTDLDRLCPPDNFDREQAARREEQDRMEPLPLDEYDLSQCNPRSIVIEEMLADTARKHDIVDLEGSSATPSCRLIVEGNSLRFPSAKEIQDQGAWRLQRELADRCEEVRLAAINGELFA